MEMRSRRGQEAAADGREEKDGNGEESKADKTVISYAGFT